MHVGIVAWGLPPCRGSGVYRPLAMLNQLHFMGLDVTALTAGREAFNVFYGADATLETRIPEQVRIRRVPFAPEARWPLVNDWTADRVRNPRAWRQSVLARELAVYPEPVYSPWLNPVSEALIELHAQQPFDLVIATGNPYVDFEAAFRLHELEGVPFVLDDRDSFLIITYSGEDSPFYLNRQPYFRKYVETATEYWSVNPPLDSLHRSRAHGNESKFHVVENGWDPYVLRSLGGRTSEVPQVGPLRFGFIGNITPYLPLEEILRGWRGYLVGTGRDDEFHLFGQFGFTNDPGSRGTAQSRAVAQTPGVHLRGRVDRAVLADAYAEVDVLVFAAPGGRYITAGKVYEYVATGLPIVALGSEDQDAMRVLGGYPRLHAAAFEDESLVTLAFASAAEDARLGAADRNAVISYAERFRRDQVLGPAFARVLGSQL